MSAAGVAIGLGLAIWFLQQQFTRNRRMISPSEAREIVEAINRAEFNGWFRADDVLAIIKIESNFDPEAVRLEPHVITPVTPSGDASIGLMQVLFSTAVDRGHRGGPADLFDPVVNVRMGMRQLFWSHEFLSRRLNRAPSTAEWIGSYNAGVGAVLKGRVPTGYVNRWTAAREIISKGGS